MKKNKQINGMVDVSQKNVTSRRAIASASIIFSPKAFKHIISQGSPKGDLFETAKIAGVMAAKSTSSIIPLCHPLPLEKIRLDFKVNKKSNAIDVSAEVLCLAKTGVEMEALTAVSVACLTIYDMTKWLGQEIMISNIRLQHKSGGLSGDYTNE